VACRTAGSCEFPSQLLKSLVDAASGGVLRAVECFGDAGVGHVGGEAQHDRAPLLGGQATDGPPELGIAAPDGCVGAVVGAGCIPCDLLGAAGRDGVAPAGTVMIDRL